MGKLSKMFFGTEKLSEMKPSVEITQNRAVFTDVLRKMTILFVYLLPALFAFSTISYIDKFFGDGSLDLVVYAVSGLLTILCIVLHVRSKKSSLTLHILTSVVATPIIALMLSAIVFGIFLFMIPIA